MKMKTKGENKARCEACGKRLRRDEGKVCRVCMGKVAKLRENAKKRQRNSKNSCEEVF